MFIHLPFYSTIVYSYHNHVIYFKHNINTAIIVFIYYNQIENNRAVKEVFYYTGRWPRLSASNLVWRHCA